VSARGGVRDVLRAAFVENFSLKVMALCCAIALFAVTHGQETAQRTFSLSLASLMPPSPAKRALMTQLPSDVLVTLRGPRTQLDELHADDIGPVHLDLQSGQDAKIDLDEKMFHVPTGVSVEGILPSSIKVKWDDVIAKSVPVQVSRTGEPRQGFAVKGVITSEPAEVVAHGPRGVLDVIQVARAAAFDVTGLGQGVHTLKLALDKPPPLVNYDLEQVSATVDITRQVVSKTFPRLKIEVIGVPRAITRPAAVNIVITGTAEDVNAIAEGALVPRVEPKAAGDDITKPGNDNLLVLLDMPKGVTAEVDPPRVVVTW
jgi:YbbR domain-containing protein